MNQKTKELQEEVVADCEICGGKVRRKNAKEHIKGVVHDWHNTLSHL
ncbi:MAG: hypothetical protein SV760_03145 [Halobacteria archaeon]|nr:hypothetical protein [Halobacteria archaeon]